MEPNYEVAQKFYAKKQAVMAAMGKLPRRGVNTHQNYNYVRDEDVIDGFRQAFVEAGLTWAISMVDHWVNETRNRTYVCLSVVFEDAETGYCSAPVTVIGEAFDKGDKGTPKAQTSALKYFLLKSFLVASGNEPDADAEPGEAPKAEEKPTRRSRARAAPARATVDQKKKIMELLKKLGIAEKDYTSTLKSAGFVALDALTKEQAAEAITRMELSIKEKGE